MTREDKGNYAAKHKSGARIGEALTEEIRTRCTHGELACRVAFDIAEKEGVEPSEVGIAADMMEIRIVKCTLGLFGYKPDKKIVRPADRVSGELGSAIRGSISAGSLPCASAWEIAAGHGIGKMEVSAACETLGVKIKPCQLGAF